MSNPLKEVLRLVVNNDSAKQPISSECTVSKLLRALCAGSRWRRRLLFETSCRPSTSRRPASSPTLSTLSGTRSSDCKYNPLSRLSIFIIYFIMWHCQINVQWLWLWLSCDQLSYFTQKKAHFLLVTIIITRTKWSTGWGGAWINCRMVHITY